MEIRTSEKPDKAEQVFIDAQWRRVDEEDLGAEVIEAYVAAGAYRKGFSISALEADRVLGNATGWISEGVCDLNSLMVSPEHRGNGVGSALLTELDHFCRQRKTYRLALRVVAGSRQHDFYKRHGWQNEVEIHDWVGGKTCWQMRKDLAPDEEAAQSPLR